MPHGKILPYHALKTLTQLHAELAGKLSANLRETKRLRLAIFQVEAVDEATQPGSEYPADRAQAPHVGQPMVQARDARQSGHRHATRSTVPMTTREISDALLAGRKKPEATRHQGDGPASGHLSGTSGAQRRGGGW